MQIALKKLLIGAQYGDFEPLHSVLEQFWIKCSYLDQILPHYESLYRIGLKKAKNKILYIGNFSTK